MGIVFSYVVKIFTYWRNYATIPAYFRVRMMTMNLNQLEYFCAAVRYGNITQAAKKLFVTQPTISGAIRELEREFSVSLFSEARSFHIREYPDTTHRRDFSKKPLDL